MQRPPDPISSLSRVPVNTPSAEVDTFQFSEINYPKQSRAVSNPEVDKASKVKKFKGIDKFSNNHESSIVCVVSNNSDLSLVTHIIAPKTPISSHITPNINENLPEQLQNLTEPCQSTDKIVSPSVIVLVNTQEISSVAEQEITNNEVAETQLSHIIETGASSEATTTIHEVAEPTLLPPSESSSATRNSSSITTESPSYAQKPLPPCHLANLESTEKTSSSIHQSFANLATFFGLPEQSKSKFKTGVTQE